MLRLAVAVGTNRLPACEGLDDEHRRTTVAADEDGLNDGCGLTRGLRRSRFGCNVQQLARSGQVVSARGVGEQPIVTDAVKAAGQNVQQERRMNSSALSVIVL